MTNPILNTAIQAAYNAGDIIRNYFYNDNPKNINEKGRNDYVTKVDNLSELEIIRTIHEAYPEHAILGEETGMNQGNQDYLWIIDPLDGTNNFIHGFPQFAISIALKRHNELYIGVIYDPVRQELFTAEDQKGAYLNNCKIHVSSCEKLSAALIAAGFPLRNLSQLKGHSDVIDTLFPHISGLRRIGSAALNLAYVACGRFDGLIEMSVKEWDMLAGILIVKEAGGLASDLDGEYKNTYSENMIAANPIIHYELLRKIKQRVGRDL